LTDSGGPRAGIVSDAPGYSMTAPSAFPRPIISISNENHSFVGASLATPGLITVNQQRLCSSNGLRKRSPYMALLLKCTFHWELALYISMQIHTADLLPHALSRMQPKVMQAQESFLCILYSLSFLFIRFEAQYLGACSEALSPERGRKWC
jgi:hypothetical protein